MAVALPELWIANPGISIFYNYKIKALESNNIQTNRLEESVGNTSYDVVIGYVTSMREL